jgi:hypothetical protein
MREIRRRLRAYEEAEKAKKEAAADTQKNLMDMLFGGKI